MRIFPVKDEQIMEKYNAIIDTANRVYAEENGSIRMRIIEKEARKLIREDAKQRKKAKHEQNFKEAAKAKEE